MDSNASGKSQAKVVDGTEYGVLNSRNIDKVVFGDYEFETWYGNSAYFAPQRGREKTRELGIGTKNERNDTPSGSFWLSKLYVCEYCFKYTTDEAQIDLHRSVCSLSQSFPPLGTLVYWDSRTPYLIKRVKGYRHEVFAQNLALFGKLFIDDKSVYYNVDYFDFYIVYGFDDNDEELYGTAFRKKFKPMGFFSHEVNSWDAHNNLACVCVFPPYQGLRLGTLLIEFSYALASKSNEMKNRSGPEFPLSPYGKKLYLRFWCKRIAAILLNKRSSDTLNETSISELSNITGFRKEDILFTLDHMEVLKKDDKGYFLSTQDLSDWCNHNGIDYTVEASMMNTQCLLL